jgi:hypothetical protein
MAAVLGGVLIVSTRKRVKELETFTGFEYPRIIDEIYHKIDEEGKRMNVCVDEVWVGIGETSRGLEETFDSKLDSRLNKLENKIKK